MSLISLIYSPRSIARMLCIVMLGGVGWVHNLSAAPLNRIEQAATPAAFAKIEIANNTGPDKLNLHGLIELGPQSDGFDPTLDRTIIVIGSRVTVIEPGSLRSAGKSGKVWTYHDPKAPFVSKLNLQKKGESLWQFELGAAAPEGNREFHLRVGNDWGGIDLSTGRSLLSFEPSLDTSHQAQATIGTGGGTVQTIDAGGVRIQLDVPAGALSQDVVITVAPLLSSPLVARSDELSPGVKFEPEGLQFATAATLTLDFGGTNKRVASTDSVFLLTSPMTMLPLYGEVDTVSNKLTASLHHFSVSQPGRGQDAFMDLRAWADSVLSTTGNLTLSELQLLLEFAALQQQAGCTTNCLDIGQLADRAGASIAALVGGVCPAGGAPAASDAALTQLLQLETLAQQLGANVPTIRPCMEAVLGALIDQAATTAANSSDPVLSRLADLAARAQALGFPQLETRALQKLDHVMRDLAARLLALVNAARGTPNEQAVTAQTRTELENAKLFLVIYVTPIEPVPLLVAHIQQAIDSLSGSLSLTVEPFGQAFIQGCGGNSRRDLPPTLNITCSGQLSSLTFTVTTGANTLTVIATGSASERGFVRAKISGRFTVNRPGRVIYDLNPSWGIPGTGARSPRVDIGLISSPTNVLPLFITGTNFWPLPTNLPLVGSTDFITGVYDFHFFVDLLGPSEGACDTGNGETCPAARANGRIVTLTFMP